MENPTGKISLNFRRKENGKTYISKQYFKLPLQIMKPHYYDNDGTACVYLLNPGGGVLQHDRLLTEISMEPGSSALVTTPSTTKFYKMDEGYALVKNCLTVQKDAVLEYLPEHNVPFEDAEAYQENIIRLEKGATLLTTDMVTAGRVSRDEIFKYKKYASRTRIYLDGELILLENNVIEPASNKLDRIGMLEGYLSNGVFYAYSEKISPDLKDTINSIDSGDVVVAAGNLRDDLMIVRFLGDNIIDIQKVMLKVWAACRKDILGKESVRIRKY